MAQLRKSNKLITEKSPYLLQHAFNPVQWYPWGDEAFEKARSENKPIFLSIGYSTCHWCHVMEHESFEGEETAKILKEKLVSIKVDREERPDVDKVYMTALQAMGQNGGWPMSMFLTPDLRPFYGGTYFPPATRYGRIGFPDLLQRIHTLWLTDRERIDESAEKVTAFLKEIPSSINGTGVDGSVIEKCFEQARSTYEPEFGGFGGPPKFPRPAVFTFLFRHHFRTGSKLALQMAEHSLQKMSEGGMYDHVGGGYHRYSVDGEWRVPHFEKMLYDQGQIVISLTEAFLMTKDARYEKLIRETLDYVLRDMTSPDGGFYSAEDADSPRPESPGEHGEGAFYVWTKKQILTLLGQDPGEVFCFHYGVEEDGNALSDPQLEFTGRNIPYIAHTLQVTAAKFGRSEAEVEASLVNARRLLFAERLKRPRPHLDDKVLTSWNGLMISAFARAAQALGEPRYHEAAAKAAGFVLSHLYRSETETLLRRYRDGESKYEGHLDDYAFFVQGLLDLHEESLEFRWLEKSIELTRTQVRIFWDASNGGFFDTSGNDASVLVRLKEQHDGAEPTGNSVAVMNLLRLAHLTDSKEWREKADATLTLFGGFLGKHPFAMPQMVAALDFSLAKIKQIIVAGKKDDPQTASLIREVHARYLPNKILLLADGAEEQKALGKVFPFINSIDLREGRPTAYVCEGFVCQLPTSDATVLASLLQEDT